MSDHILIKDLECFAYHGVLEAEKQLGQKFLVSLDLQVDTRRAGQTDALDASINYASVCQDVMTFMKEQRFALIEAVAEQLAEYLLLHYALLEGIQIEIKKPWAPVMLPLDTVAVRIERKWHKVYFGIGSNMGDKEQHIRDAIAVFSEHSKCRNVEVSSFYATKPYGVTEQDDFVNGVFSVETLLTPEEVLVLIQEIETMQNRVRTIHWGPRTIDVDILFYDDAVIGTKELMIPHTEIAKRAFVLIPLCELAEFMVHPVSGKRMKELLEELTVADYEQTIEVKKIMVTV